MSFELNAGMPSALDGLHLILAVLVVVLLVLLILKAKSKSASAPVEASSQPESMPTTAEPAPASLKQSNADSALQLLGMLQQEARFIDFLQEDVAAYSDAEVGAVARVIHDSGKKVLDQYFTLEPIRSEQEDTQVTLAPGFDSGANRVTGNVVGEPPFTGLLVHRGWRAAKVNLPKLAESHDVNVIAPAEVEL